MTGKRMLHKQLTAAVWWALRIWWRTGAWP